MMRFEKCLSLRLSLLFAILLTLSACGGGGGGNGEGGNPDNNGQNQPDNPDNGNNGGNSGPEVMFPDNLIEVAAFIQGTNIITENTTINGDLPDGVVIAIGADDVKLQLTGNMVPGSAIVVNAPFKNCEITVNGNVSGDYAVPATGFNLLEIVAGENGTLRIDGMVENANIAGGDDSLIKGDIKSSKISHASGSFTAENNVENTELAMFGVFEAVTDINIDGKALNIAVNTKGSVTISEMEGGEIERSGNVTLGQADSVTFKVISGSVTADDFTGTTSFEQKILGGNITANGTLGSGTYQADGNVVADYAGAGANILADGDITLQASHPDIGTVSAGGNVDLGEIEIRE